MRGARVGDYIIVQFYFNGLGSFSSHDQTRTGIITNLMHGKIYYQGQTVKYRMQKIMPTKLNFNTSLDSDYKVYNPTDHPEFFL